MIVEWFLPEFIANRLSVIFSSMLGATLLSLLPSTKEKGKLLERLNMKNFPWGNAFIWGWYVSGNSVRRF